MQWSADKPMCWSTDWPRACSGKWEFADTSVPLLRSVKLGAQASCLAEEALDAMFKDIPWGSKQPNVDDMYRLEGPM